jgi:hypothetical protein
MNKVKSFKTSKVYNEIYITINLNLCFEAVVYKYDLVYSNLSKIDCVEKGKSRR